MEKGIGCSRGAISPLINNILLPDVRFKHGPDFSLRDKRLFEITEIEITRVDCIIIILFICQINVYCNPSLALPQSGSPKNWLPYLSGYKTGFLSL